MSTETPHSMFDLSDSKGTNLSERFLVELCRRTFLSLWSFPNTFTSEGLREGAGSSGKEFIDVLVVFGDDVLLFSDKEISFDNSGDLQVTWPRWFKRAVEKSAGQLYGARSWLLRFPDKIFLDAECKRPLPVSVPVSDKARVHLIATTRGTNKACAERFPGSVGSHFVNTSIEGNNHRNNPFMIGVLNRSKPFVHVFDELSLETVLRELDTIADFVGYLRAREEFLSANTPRVFAPGEEQLLGAYLTHGGDNGNWFLPPTFANSADILTFDESHFSGLINDKRFQLKKRADRISYYWDGLIEAFITLGDPKHGGFGGEYLNKDTERALRAMAAESRFRRRLLCEVFQGMLELAKCTPNQLRARLFSTKQTPDLVYVFLAYPRLPGQSKEDYRSERSSCLMVYTQCAPLRWPEGKTFIGIAVDHPTKNYSGRSEDLLVYTPGELTEADLAELRGIADSADILPVDGIPEYSETGEYPPLPKSPKSPRSKTDKRKTQKKQQKASKRKNRK